MKLITILSVAFLATIPTIAFGQFSTLIESDLSSGDLNSFLNTIYLIAISVAALIAVIKIILAGVKYMLTDIVTSKEDAKKDIRTSLLGLIVVMSAILILEVINPSLTDFNLQFTKPGENFERELSREGQSPNVEYELSNYNETDINFCLPEDWFETLTFIVLPASGVKCSTPITLNSKYTETKDTDIYYNAIDHCTDKIGKENLDKKSLIDALWSGDTIGQSCLDTVEELLFEGCTVRGNGLNYCDQGWCQHNAGQKINTGTIGLFACRLPFERFNETEVKEAFEATGQPSISFGVDEYTTGCRALRAREVDIDLSYTGGPLVDLRCVQR